MTTKTGYIYDRNGMPHEVYIHEENIFDKLWELDLYVFFPLMGLIAEGIVLFPVAILLWIINRKDNCVVSFLKKHSRKEVVFFDNTSFFVMLKKVGVWWLTFGPIRKTKEYLTKKRDEKILPAMDKTVDYINKAKDDLDNEMDTSDHQE